MKKYMKMIRLHRVNNGENKIKPKNKKLNNLLILFVAVLFTLANCASFGRAPRGERLERIKNSPNYNNETGMFEYKALPSEIPPPNPERRRTSRFASLMRFAFRGTSKLRPKENIPVIKTDLGAFSREENVYVWFGHSSFFLQTEGKRFLIDPVFVKGAPVNFANKPFKGTMIYKPEDVPEIDYLVISHDHWDHLDYGTVKKIKERVGYVICGLGVGEHFERWGFDKDRIIELDWGENTVLDDGIILNCLPARHFSGRGLTNRNSTLFVSYVLKTNSRTIFISGDGGYGSHFAEIGRQFEPVDLAIMENGQYNTSWSTNHLMPADLVKAVKDINPKKLLTVHNSKFILSSHTWEDPLVNISKAAEEEGFNLLTPMLGEPVYLDDDSQVFQKWWEAPAADK